MGNELFRADEQTGRQTDRYDEADTGFSLFCKRAKKTPVNYSVTNYSAKLKLVMLHRPMLRSDGSRLHIS